MSYPPLSNYGGYYDSSNQGQSMNNSFGGSRQTNSNNQYSAQPSYSGDVRQNQYNSTSYDWSGEQQQDYTGSSRQRQSYDNDGWNGINAQNTASSGRTQASNYATQAAVGNAGGAYYENSRPTTQSTQGLNNLAYASGLDGAGLQRHPQQAQRTNAPSAPAYTSAPSSSGTNRVRSPLATHNTSRYNTTPSTYGYQNDSNSMEGQGDELSAAAAALAGAVSAPFQQASASLSAQSASPVMDEPASLQQNAPRRTASPYYQTQTQGVRAQTQQRQASGTPQQNYRSSNQASSQQRAQQTAKSVQHGRVASQNANARQSQTQATPVNSISNLVTHTVEESSQPQYSTAQTMQSITGYIDPTQVFNPYAKEHERRRREAAEAEARKKIEEESAAKRKIEEEAAAEKKRVEEAAAAKKRQQEAAATTVKANKSKKRTPTSAANTQQHLHNTMTPQVDTQSSAASGETDMAAELKAMMEKMKEFRSKDPSLFQKLWEDNLRKPGTPAGVAIQSPSPQIAQQSLPEAQDRAPPAAAMVQSNVAQPATPQAAGSSASKLRRKVYQPAEVPVGARANGYKVIVEDNEEGLPDLGRYPAERRVRGVYDVGKKERKSQTSHESPASYPASMPNIPQPSPSQAQTPFAPAPPGPAAMVSTGLPTRSPSGGTIWPEEKRNGLTEAAVKTLNSIPENAGIKITTNDIHAMLEQNPSYIDLCELLEKKGLSFNRGHFARQLLSNVPYLNAPKAQTPAPASARPAPPPPTSLARHPEVPRSNGGPVTAPNGVGVDRAMPVMAGQAPLPSIPVGGRARPPMGTFPVASFNQERRPGVPAYGPASVMQQQRPGRPLMSTRPLRPEPPPGSKEAQARKRDFSELVDLTVLSDNEDYVTTKDSGRVTSPSPEPRDPFQQFRDDVVAVRATMPVGGFPQHGAALRFDPTQLQRYPQGYAPLPHFPKAAPPSFQAIGPVQKEVRYHAKSVNREEALRKTYYDAKTVARDLLIAAGRHPTERPLNAHMAGLLGKHVDIDSDLSTFDWDAVDPGGPSMPQVAFAAVPMDPPRFRIGEVGIRRSKLNESITADSSSKSDTEKDKEHQKMKTRVEHEDGAEEEPPARLPEADQSEMSPPVPRRPGRPPRQSLPRAASPASPVQVDTDVRRAQHLRRSSNRVTDRPSLTVDSVVPQKRQASAIVSPPDSPHQDKRRATQSVFTQLTPSAAPPSRSSNMGDVKTFSSGKRVGRPPGAKNRHPTFGAMRKAAAQLSGLAVTPASPATPTLPIFKCKWRMCHAELHNLETLRNHVAQVHNPTPESRAQTNGYVCWWKKCPLLKDAGDSQLTPTRIFEKRADWLEHIDGVHVKTVAARIGDGPSLRHIDPQTIPQDRTRYLSDSHGRITTPDVSNERFHEDLPADTMTLVKAGHEVYEEQAMKSFMKTHRTEAKSSPKALAEETLKAMSARKAKIGPGIDRGGCVLVTEERRKAFVQNPGIQRIVDADY